MKEDNNGSATSNRKRRWFQYRLRTLLLVTGLFAWGLGVTVQRAREQRRLADAIGELHGVYVTKGAREPEWLLSLIGEQYLTRIDGVHLGGMTAGENAIDILGMSFERRFSIGDAELAGVAQLPAMRRATMLFLAGTSITDSGLKHLNGLSNLRVLDIGHTQVSARAVHDLQESLPECRITHGSHSPHTSLRTALRYKKGARSVEEPVAVPAVPENDPFWSARRPAADTPNAVAIDALESGLRTELGSGPPTVSYRPFLEAVP